MRLMLPLAMLKKMRRLALLHAPLAMRWQLHMFLNMLPEALITLLRQLRRKTPQTLRFKLRMNTIGSRSISPNI